MEFETIIIKFITGGDGLAEWKKLSNAKKIEFGKYVRSHKTLHKDSKSAILWATT